MPADTMTARIESLRGQINAPHEDPAALFNAVQAVIEDLQQTRQAVPSDLRQFVEELEAEVVEEFYDNLPV